MTHIQEITFIDKLIEMTQHDKLTWVTARPDRRMNSSVEYVEIVYQTYFQNILICIYERNYKYYYDETDFSWDKEVIVELRDPETNITLQELKSNNAVELLRALNYRKLSSFYSNVLA